MGGFLGHMRFIHKIMTEHVICHKIRFPLIDKRHSPVRACKNCNAEMVFLSLRKGNKVNVGHYNL